MQLPSGLTQLAACAPGARCLMQPLLPAPLPLLNHLLLLLPSLSHHRPPPTAYRPRPHGVTPLVKCIRCRLQRAVTLPSCSQPIAAHYVANHLVSSHACFALARYGLYALRARSSATHVSPPPDMPHNVAASAWQCRASSNRLQVQSVTPAFLHSANGGDV